MALSHKNGPIPFYKQKGQKKIYLRFMNSPSITGFWGKMYIPYGTFNFAYSSLKILSRFYWFSTILAKLCLFWYFSV